MEMIFVNEKTGEKKSLDDTHERQIRKREVIVMQQAILNRLLDRFNRLGNANTYVSVSLQRYCCEKRVALETL